MAQPAVTKNPLGITPFWQKASAEPPLEWDKWNQQLFLGIIAKDGVNLKKLLQNKLPQLIGNPMNRGTNSLSKEKPKNKLEIAIYATKKNG